MRWEFLEIRLTEGMHVIAVCGITPFPQIGLRDIMISWHYASSVWRGNTALKNARRTLQPISRALRSHWATRRTDSDSVSLMEGASSASPMVGASAQVPPADLDVPVASQLPPPDLPFDNALEPGVHRP